LDQVIHQLVSKLAQIEDEQQMQPMGDELVNAPNMDVTHWVGADKQHQNATKLVMYRNSTVLSITH
jgi:hypothetical protein